MRQETERRAVFGQTAARVPELETRLAGRDRALAEQQAKSAELEGRLTEERKASAEKLALPNEAQEKLADAFKAMSSDALTRNNLAFLDLTSATLEKFQEGATPYSPLRRSLAAFSAA